MADVYCYLCGANATVADALNTEIASAFAKARPAAAALPTDTPFHFAPDDIKWQEDLCLVGPLGDKVKGPFPWTVTAPAAIQAIDLKNIRVLWSMEPGDSHEFATVVHRVSGRQYDITGNTYPFTHAGCMRIFAQVLKQSPRGLVHPGRVFWAVLRQQNIDEPASVGIDGISWGREIDLTQSDGDFVSPLANVWDAFHGKLCHGLPHAVIRSLEYGKYSRRALHNWWRGPGAMYLFVRPDRFPVSEAYNHCYAISWLPPASAVGCSALEQLPVELLTTIVEFLDHLTDLSTLLCVSKSIRRTCHIFINSLIRALAPDWMKPPQRILKTLQNKQYPPFPWLKYAHYCHVVSPNMRNRWRIFDVCRQIMAIADNMTDEELGQLVLAGDVSV